MSIKNWRTRVWAAALALVMGAGAVAADDNGGLQRLIGAGQTPSSQPTTRPTFDATRRLPSAPRFQTTIKTTFARDVLENLDGSDDNGKKRYLVCFLGTKRFAYWDEYKDPRNRKGLIAREGEVYDEPLWRYIEASYCLAGITLRRFGNFDDMVTIAGEYFNKAQVEATFDALAAQTKPGDEIFIYWNGHGMALETDDDGDERDISNEGNNGEGQSADVDEALVLFEFCNCTNPSLRLSDQLIRDTTVVDDDLGKYFEKLKGRSVVAFFETCHAGGLAVRSDVVSGNANSRALNAALPKPPIPPVVKTWAELKDPKVDSTDDLLKLAGVEAALTLIELDVPAPSRDPNPAPNPESDMGGGRPSSLDDLIRRTSNNDSYARPSARVFSAPTLDALINGDSKNATGGSKDITNQTLQRMAVAMTSLYNQNSSAGFVARREDGKFFMAPTNPGAFSICMLFNAAVNDEMPATFADFKAVLDELVAANNETLNEIHRRENKPEAIQTPGYVSNWDDAVLYDPSWPVYWDEQWEQGGEKWEN